MLVHYWDIMRTATSSVAVVTRSIGSSITASRTMLERGNGGDRGVLRHRSLGVDYSSAAGRASRDGASVPGVNPADRMSVGGIQDLVGAKDSLAEPESDPDPELRIRLTCKVEPPVGGAYCKHNGG